MGQSPLLLTGLKSDMTMNNTWSAGEQTLSFDVPQQLSPVIVVVKKMDGARFVKLVK